MTDNNDRYTVKVSGRPEKVTKSLNDAYRIAQEDLLKYNMKFSYATIRWQYGLNEETTFRVMVGADYSHPRDAISHGCPFVALVNGKIIGKLNLDGTYVKDVVA